jgi:hypothetical protein
LLAKAWQGTDPSKASASDEVEVEIIADETLDLNRTTPEQPSPLLRSTSLQDRAQIGLFTSPSKLLTRKTMSLSAASVELGLLGAAGSLVHTVGLSQVRLPDYHHND